jgi:RNA polymerase sigma-70 factor (ECF subfamily)
MTSPPLERFKTLIDRHHDELYAYLWRMLDGASAPDAAIEAADLTQEVFERAYKAYRRFQPGTNARAWLYKIATNAAISLIRKRRADLPLLDEVDEAPPADEPEPQALHAESVEMLQQAIEGLPAKQRAALLMRYIQELDYPEIASALACSEDSARANVYQALKRLRAMLEEHHEQHA